ncbi:MAG: hypothetical protein D5R99_06215 [Methanocalculus sp. MSAO_Arc1]|uniref:hypothetical protein n=1 Tax=Methanocalculus TaxID=71151 RepID=UPI000FEE2123|nr:MULTISPECIES: hypothetical protein [unclassified Methanocalculus]MCP1662880.1 hypothetical protein [Methanocalculus sp. AMF5]RQD80030.1 MAG: hypothetical protein D5R99_06215 [Methanocalculus sp. MSAO_Arc1]
MRLWAVASLALALLLVQAAAGFFVDDAEGLPDGYLISGELQEIDLWISFPGFDDPAFPSGDRLILETDLVNPAWNADLKRHGGTSTLRQERRTRVTITGWELAYPAADGMILHIRLTGIIPDMESPKKIQLLRIRQIDGTSQVRQNGEYSISQIASNQSDLPSKTPPAPVVVEPPPPDLSAFTVSSRLTTPTGDLEPGETVTLRTHLSFDRLTQTAFPLSDTLRLRTSLSDARWDVRISIRGGESVRAPGWGYFYSIPGFELSYPARDRVSVSVAVTGEVPEAAGGPLLEISQCGPDGYAREGAVFAHPAVIAGSHTTEPPDTIEPTPTEPPTITPTPTEVPEPVPPTPVQTPLPRPTPKGELFPDGFSLSALGDLTADLIDHARLFVERVTSVVGA